MLFHLFFISWPTSILKNTPIFKNTPTLGIQRNGPFGKGHIFMWYFNYHYENYFICLNLSHLVSLCTHVLSRLRCVWPFATLWTVARQAPLSMRFSCPLSAGGLFNWYLTWPVAPDGVFLSFYDKVAQAHLIHVLSLIYNQPFLQRAQVLFSRKWCLEATEIHASLFSGGSWQLCISFV